MYIAMKLVEGHDLSYAIDKERKTDQASEDLTYYADSVVAWLGTVGRALDFARSQGLIHRDVDPANILVEPVPMVGLQFLLGEFGLAKSIRLKKITKTGAVMGTIASMAPEQLHERQRRWSS